MDPDIILAVTILEYIFCLIGISALILVCAIILKYRKTTFSNTFYTLVLALSVPDLLHLFSEIFCALPATFYGLEDTPKWFIYSCGFVANVSFWGIAPLMLIIAINRYMAVCHFQKYQQIFRPNIVTILIILSTIGSFLMPSIMYGCKCYYNFGFAWTFFCMKDGCMDFALNLNTVIANGICVLIVLIYVRIFWQYRSIRKQLSGTLSQADDDKKRRAKETTLMIQFSLISFVLIANQIFFWVFSKVAKNAPCEMILNFLRNLNSCVSAFLYLTFGSEIKSRLPWKKQAVHPSNITRATVTTRKIEVISVKPIEVAPVDQQE